MKTSVGFVIVFLVLASNGSTQEHATNVEICRANQAVWGNTQAKLDYATQEKQHATQGLKNTNAAAELSYKQLLSRQDEILTCASIDALNSDQYMKAFNFYAQVARDRFENFIIRHNLMQRFLREDAAGLR